MQRAAECLREGGVGDRDRCGRVDRPAPRLAVERGQVEPDDVVTILGSDPAELIEFLIPRMPRFAIPRFVEIWDALPKTEATARIQKAKIRDSGVTESTWDRVAAGIVIPR